jgi:hypothetical protein
MLAILLPALYVAVTVVIVIEVITVNGQRRKIVMLWPAGTMKLDGPGRPELLADKLTMAPTDGAGPLSGDDSVAVDPLVTVQGLIENPLSGRR